MIKANVALHTEMKTFIIGQHKYISGVILKGDKATLKAKDLPLQTRFDDVQLLT